ncbi:MAG TPA: DUF5666 domain-containing protein [Acidobacteriaceae bacterium]
MVTLVASSNGNDQFSQLSLFLNSLTLTSESGAPVSVLPAPQYIEFIHLNGAAEPVATVSVPQDIYTSAAVTVGSADAGCVFWDPSESASGVVDSDILYGYTPDSQVSVAMANPLKVERSSMGILLNLAVSASAKYANCVDLSLPPGDAITPTFDLSSFQIGSQVGNPAVGAMTGLDGIVASLDTADQSFAVTASDGYGVETLNSGEDISSRGLAWRAIVNSATTWEGISGISELAVGVPVDIDAQLQADGTLLASRVAVANRDPSSLTVVNGPILEVASFEPGIEVLQRQEEGYLIQSIDPPQNPGGGGAFDYSSADFETSGQATNLQSLPFTARFDSGSAVAGQAVSITLNATSLAYDGPAATTVTLIPQTLDGTVAGVATQGAFTEYTVTLPSYDLFPTLAFTDSFQTSPLQNPRTVVVYADANTRTLNTTPVAVGSVQRFTGLVFNADVTLRMDCLQIADGVPE